MKKAGKVRVLLILAAFAAASAITVYAAYDSSTDPIVSLSYLTSIFKPQIDSQVNAVKSSVSSVQSGVSALSTDVAALKSGSTALGRDIDAAESDIDELQKGAETAKSDIAGIKDELGAVSEKLDELDGAIPGESAEYGFETVRLTGVSSKITANGACDMLVRSGAAIVTVPDGAQAVDITTYTTLKSGDTIRPEHLIIMTDGVSLTSSSGEAYILVKGNYNAE